MHVVPIPRDPLRAQYLILPHFNSFIQKYKLILDILILDHGGFQVVGLRVVLRIIHITDIICSQVLVGLLEADGRVLDEWYLLVVVGANGW